MPQPTPAALVTVGPTLPAIEAFAVMCRRQVSGVGVMDHGGEELIANLSVSVGWCELQPVLDLPGSSD